MQIPGQEVEQIGRCETHLTGPEVKLRLLHVTLLLGSQGGHLVFFLPLQEHRLGCLISC